MSLLAEASEWAAGLRFADIPDDVRDLAAATLTSGMAAAWAGGQPPASARVAARWPAAGARGAALRGAAMTMLLDWDETCFAGHVGHSTAVPALLLGADAGAAGADVMTALVAGCEVAARVTAALTLGRARGQAAAHTHLAGATVTAGLLAGFDASRLGAALALALSQPREVLLPAFMGSDAKFAVAAGPMGDAHTCLDAAAAGARVELDIMERQGGLLDRLCDVPLPQAMGDYGTRWHLRTMCFKRDPGCAYISAAIEGAAGLGPLDLATVEAVEIGCSAFTIGMEAESAAFVDGPASPMAALNFSAGYSVAAALQQGELQPRDFSPAQVADEARWRVARLVSLHHDPGLSLSALAATAPIGMALAWAGEQARPYLERRGATPEMVDRVLAAAAQNLDDPTFLRPAKRIGADIVVRLSDGRRLESGRGAAAGSCQQTVAERVRLADAKLAMVAPGAHAPHRLGELAAAELRELAVPLRQALDAVASAP